MAVELEYLAAALEDAEAIARWYAERSPSAARGFDAELDAAERAISEQHEVEPRRAVIVAVAHARRRPGYWKSRERRSA